ncbi:mediator complex subunit 25 [Echinococcus multilocularis]|uniref:Mediator complex subunit 25 n=1 Tax=Echinococcus multilocularis TaxID=6211 RepID=A0A0S4MJY8_ECHMU|nr:mediator complex subunit 25 [Echinococcus multilocularis]
MARGENATVWFTAVCNLSHVVVHITVDDDDGGGGGGGSDDDVMGRMHVRKVPTGLLGTCTCWHYTALAVKEGKWSGAVGVRERDVGGQRRREVGRERVEESERDARRLPTGKNYAPERTRLESVAGFNTAECNAEPPPGVRALLITLNPAPGKFDALHPHHTRSHATTCFCRLASPSPHIASHHHVLPAFLRPRTLLLTRQPASPPPSPLHHLTTPPALYSHLLLHFSSTSP